MKVIFKTDVGVMVCEDFKLETVHTGSSCTGATQCDLVVSSSGASVQLLIRVDVSLATDIENKIVNSYTDAISEGRKVLKVVILANQDCHCGWE